MCTLSSVKEITYFYFTVPRNYLAKLEAEKREQEIMLAELRAQLHREREEKDNLLAK